MTCIGNGGESEDVSDYGFGTEVQQKEGTIEHLVEENTVDHAIVLLEHVFNNHTAHPDEVTILIFNFKDLSNHDLRTLQETQHLHPSTSDNKRGPITE